MATNPEKPVDHPLTEKEIKERAKSDTPHFKLFVQDLKGTLKKSKPTAGESLQALYFSTESNGLNFPASKIEGNTSVIITLKKGEQHGYIISNCVIPDTCLKVTQETVKSKRVVRFTDSQQTESQLLLCKDPRSETKFALYRSAPDSKGYNKFFYLTPKSGTIMAEESSSADGYYNFSMYKATLPGRLTTTTDSDEQPDGQQNGDTGQSIPSTSLVHNSESFRNKAISDKPFFLLRKEYMGYFYVGGNPPVNLYFNPETFNLKHWPSDKTGALKIVYHEEESKKTGEKFYLTIKSALNLEKYLAVNFDQPSQEGSDTYPVQFISTTMVKWYQKKDTETQFSLYTYKEGEGSKYICSLQNNQVFAVRYQQSESQVFDSIKFDAAITPSVRLGGQIETLSELRSYTDNDDNSPFPIVMRLPNGNRSPFEVFVDTSMYELGYREPPPSSPAISDLSVILMIQKTDEEDVYILSSFIFTNRYLTTGFRSVTGRLVSLGLVLEGTPRPRWTAIQRGSEHNFGFRYFVNEQVYYLTPISMMPMMRAPTPIANILVAESQVNRPISIFRVDNVDSNIS